MTVITRTRSVPRAGAREGAEVFESKWGAGMYEKIQAGINGR